MLSKTLIKLIDYSVFPAVIVVAVKVLSAIVLLNKFQVGYEATGLTIVFKNAEAFVAVNTYSSLIMFLAVLTGLSWVVLKAHVFHDTHITPVLSAKLVELDLEELVNDTKTIFSQAFIWLTYAWLSTVIIGIQAFYSMSYAWVFYFSLLASVLATSLLAYDVERELVRDEEELKKDEKRLQEESILRFNSLSEDLFS